MFWAQQNLGVQKNFGEALPPNAPHPPVATGLSSGCEARQDAQARCSFLRIIICIWN